MQKAKDNLDFSYIQHKRKEVYIREHLVRHLFRRVINSVKIASRGRQNGAPFISESERKASPVTEHSVIL